MKKMLLPLFMTKLIFSLVAGSLADADLAKITSHLKSPPEKPWTWVFYGDSITQGAVHTHGWRAFPEIFAECLRYENRRPLDRVINSGISGHTSEELLNGLQYDWRVRSLQPSVVIIMIGMNDIVSGRTPEKFQNNLSNLVDRIRSDGAIPILQTSNTIQKVENPTKPYQKNYLIRYERLPQYMEIVRTVAREKDVILVDHFSHWSKNAADPDVLASWLGETIHPGGRGHREIATLLLKTIGMYSPQSQTLRYPPEDKRRNPEK
ncbi:MAG: SGNH/GDSL hydrolase family protein [Oligosphaeraceae bacterium]|nr:SGNH/GDSL hydrolase family protein [Oligosphaeraceae bacterium]